MLISVTHVTCQWSWWLVYIYSDTQWEEAAEVSSVQTRSGEMMVASQHCDILSDTSVLIHGRKILIVYHVNPFFLWLCQMKNWINGNIITICYCNNENTVHVISTQDCHVKHCHPGRGEWCVYPLSDVWVHHEVVNMLLCSGQLQLPGNYSHHQDCAACSLWQTQSDVC